ncbi:hypothetical protein [Thiocystis violascens]|uniref:Uncharacterized protein n=1 Tax=Thiocystis violascens (strain ATCC 17096 / DSM 198 / 6111) TaxID=765911 RepID=I3YD36_THIV6|nr:hypothetical protein [Thiocystis violascens]AFL74904.1 hypothetical protein Thivi_3023 [Thiocystis violascens DSM 198]
MPRRLRMQGLQAELASLSDLLQSAKEMDDPVGEFQLEKRKKKIESELLSLVEHPEKKASIALFFGGKPVLGSRGISADFAAHMLESFQDLVARSFASAELGMLGGRGPIPMRQATNLMVTNLTKGSFGFVLDELSDQEETDTTALKFIVEEVVRTLGKVSSSNELDFEEVAETLEPRMLISLKDFFVTLDSAEGTIRLVDDVADISLDLPAIHRGRIRTEVTSIDETDITIEGILIGILPEHRKFEMLVDGQMLYGSVSKEAAEEYSGLIGRGEKPERKAWKVRIKRRIVTPLSRPAREVNRLLGFLGKMDV